MMSRKICSCWFKLALGICSVMLPFILLEGRPGYASREKEHRYCSYISHNIIKAQKMLQCLHTLCARVWVGSTITRETSLTPIYCKCWPPSLAPNHRVSGLPVPVRSALRRVTGEPSMVCRMAKKQIFTGCAHLTKNKLDSASGNGTLCYRLIESVHVGPLGHPFFWNLACDGILGLASYSVFVLPKMTVWVLLW